MESPHIFQNSSPTREESNETLFFKKKKKKTISKETDHKASDEGNKSRLCYTSSGISPPPSESAGFVVMAKRVVSREGRSEGILPDPEPCCIEF